MNGLLLRRVRTNFSCNASQAAFKTKSVTTSYVIGVETTNGQAMGWRGGEGGVCGGVIKPSGWQGRGCVFGSNELLT